MKVAADNRCIRLNSNRSFDSTILKQVIRSCRFSKILCYILLVFTYVQRRIAIKYNYVNVHLGPRHDKSVESRPKRPIVVFNLSD